MLGIPVSRSGVVDVSASLLAKPADESLVITFVNPHACKLGKQYENYVGLLESFDIVTCDGIAMVQAARSCGLNEVRRESFDFTSIAGPVFEWAASNGKSVGLLGGEPGVAETAAGILARKFAGLEINHCFSGFGQDLDKALQCFAEKRTDIVICGMGAPLQEQFLLRLVNNGWCGIGFTCGGFLDQTSKGTEYYPPWVDRLNLRFLYRLAKEPRRLWRRYLVDYQVFIYRYTRLQLHNLVAQLRSG